MSKPPKWRKKGLIFEPAGRVDWIKSYAWVPVVESLDDRGHYRMYFSGRNEANMSQPGAYTFHIDKPKEILDFTAEPVLSLGALGTFDDSGIIPSWILNHAGKKYLYYSGWMQGKRVPFYSSLGAAVSEDNGKTFKKLSSAPLLTRTDIDPLFTASAAVIVENGIWRMWYTSNTAWRIVDGNPLPRYHLKYAESTDGVCWDRRGRVAIDFLNDDEYAISRPWIVVENGVYKMWYSYRGPSYRIGYAESPDGIAWNRMDELAGIDVSAAGWDSEMIAYAAVIEHQGGRYMFYNGNNYGQNGIGIAVEE
ncbi:MAG: hypothetical protein ABIJ96_13955 [Elusimicrobiota bacterium]